MDQGGAAADRLIGGHGSAGVDRALLRVGGLGGQDGVQGDQVPGDRLSNRVFLSRQPQFERRFELAEEQSSYGDHRFGQIKPEADQFH